MVLSSEFLFEEEESIDESFGENKISKDIKKILTKSLKTPFSEIQKSSSI